ncbi:hypothetical protein F511_22813 [Dorcoceras hygrometricum]|uniref:Uncharacterized protein n=1 Tax=Dorcoceras hygrometricum TaxID=472368 RepID=A0A2Z7C1U7_9LAMI|nr:hypothetical protein F511_22813 [Dorcoceras hygrometricum]
MPFSSSTDFHQKSFRIRHEDSKLFNKLLSKENSKSYPSFRVYYGDVSGAVPFVWETCPGTPKHTFAYESNAPPLTPPPSYYANTSKRRSKNQSRSKLLLYALLRRMNPRKYHASSSPNSTISSVSSLSWSPSSRSSFSDAATTPRPYAFAHRRKRFSSWDSTSFYFDRAPEHHGKCSIDTSSSSKSCFTPGKHRVWIVKKALLSIVGRGSHA